MKISDTQRAEFRAAHPDWAMEGESIIRTFALSDFQAAMAFAVRVGFLAEAADHHPDIDIRWNKVTLVLSTHDEGALTEKDTSLAAAIDQIL